RSARVWPARVRRRRRRGIARRPARRARGRPLSHADARARSRRRPERQDLRGGCARSGTDHVARRSARLRDAGAVSVRDRQRRPSRARDKMGAPTIRLALDLEHVAARLTAPSATVAAVRESLAQLRQFADAIGPRDKKTAILAPGLAWPKSPAERLETALDE